jgi:predicted MFS family arabinose efflux permease
MQSRAQPPFLLLLLLISFGSITAVAFTPALPQITQFFNISTREANLTITLFLVGYAVGQLIYGPLANRFGRKVALYMGITLEIIASIVCALAGPLQSFWLLVIARLFMALGASVGLKMSFTLVADTHTAEQARKTIAHLMIAFAITPALGVAIGGFLTEHFSWQASFYFMAAYGMILLTLCMRMQETAKNLDTHALKFNKIINKYAITLKTPTLSFAAFLMGSATAYVYVFVSVAPFIAMEIIGLSPAQYGLWNLVPMLGIILGSQLSAHMSGKLSAIQAILLGLSIMLVGILLMFAGFLHTAQALFLFVPLLIIYMGMGFVYANASSIATGKLEDKSNASAMMSFINMGLATLCVLLISLIHITSALVLPLIYFALLALAFGFTLILKKFI